jgi:hypothetical protein
LGENGVCIGARHNKDGILNHFFDGWIDEVRISKFARYDKDFVPDKVFKPDDNTLGLYHFDEGSGDTVRDSSGRNFHGKIIGAKWVKKGSVEMTPRPERDFALRFGGANDHVECPAPLREQLAALKEFTVELILSGEGEEPKKTAELLLWENQFNIHYSPPAKETPGAWKLAVTGEANVGAATWKFPGKRTRRHFAVVRQNDQMRFFIDGKVNGPITLKSPLPKAGRFLIGGVGDKAFPGRVEELRISKVARYTQDFFPSDRQLDAEADTIALYHFEEGEGEELKDSSGNNHHAKIVGAKWVQADGTDLAPKK